ncbi:phosphoglycerate mutase [Nitrococcus mobilis Nb-231]|uniref:Phosphoglycerate mutase n=2 Tax=Nitrococcus mobilis TaxID=35797 RepID=A4BTV3_9GAMM|nr:phosphoglycerate mutase [Nitrococcus mobilis Nb-231]
MEKAMRCILVRHAESVGNAEGRLQGHAEFDLTNVGRRQAERLFQRLQMEGLEPTHVYCSPLRRTVETARIVSRSWQAPLTLWGDLIEYNVGVFSGLRWEDIDMQYPTMAQAFRESGDWAVVEGAEDLMQRHARGRRVVASLVEGHRSGDVIVAFSHGGILQHIIAAFLGTDRSWGIRVRNTAVFDFTLDKNLWYEFGSVRRNTRHWRILSFNDAAHLELDYGAAEQTGSAKEA